MDKNLDALWLEEMEPHIDGKIIRYLRTHHGRYGKLLQKHEELLKSYPVLVSVINEDEKITLDQEEHCALRRFMAVQNEMDSIVIPFASTQIRAIAGLAGFLIIMLLQKKGRNLAASFKDGKSMGAAASGTFFGPFLGVSLSLLAVNYTEAGIASTIMALTPILIILPSKLIYKEKITARQVIGAVISVTGASIFFI